MKSELLNISYFSNIDVDKFAIKDIVENITCDTCGKYEDYVNTSFMCPEYTPIDIGKGKLVCTKWVNVKTWRKDGKEKR